MKKTRTLCPLIVLVAAVACGGTTKPTHAPEAASADAGAPANVEEAEREPGLQDLPKPARVRKKGLKLDTSSQE